MPRQVNFLLHTLTRLDSCKFFSDHRHQPCRVPSSQELSLLVLQHPQCQRLLPNHLVPLFQAFRRSMPGSHSRTTDRWNETPVRRLRSGPAAPVARAVLLWHRALQMGALALLFGQPTWDRLWGRASLRGPSVGKPNNDWQKGKWMKRTSVGESSLHRCYLHACRPTSFQWG